MSALALVVALDADDKPASASKPPVFVRFHGEPLPGSNPKPITELGIDDCRWPVELVEKPDLEHGCAEPKQAGRVTSYCRFHSGLAFRRTDLLGARYVKSTERWAK